MGKSDWFELARTILGAVALWMLNHIRRNTNGKGDSP